MGNAKVVSQGKVASRPSNGEREDSSGHIGKETWADSLVLLKRIEKDSGSAITNIVCRDAPHALYHGPHGGAPVSKGAFKVTVADGRIFVA